MAGGLCTIRFFGNHFSPFVWTFCRAAEIKTDGLLSSARGDDYPHYHTTLCLSAFEITFSGVNS